MRLYLPPKRFLSPTSEEDPLRCYYAPFLASIFRRRLLLALKLLPGSNAMDRILEVGFGSGILFPSLQKRARHIYGVDLHEKMSAIRSSTGVCGTPPHLCRADAGRLPFRDNIFDAVIGISLIGYLPSPGTALQEWLRVLKPEGSLILGFPAVNILTLWAIPYCRRRSDSLDQRKILNLARQTGFPLHVLRFPSWTPPKWSLYYCCRIRKTP